MMKRACLQLVASTGVAVALAFALALLPGCSTGSTVTKVMVDLKLDTQPLSEADVQLLPKDDPSLGDGCSGRTAADGKVEIIPNPKKPLKPGRYVVLVKKLVGKDGAAFKLDEDIAVRPGREGPGGSHNILPPIYSERERSPFIVTLTAGENTVPLTVNSKQR
jgi:hypothetical protein